MRAFILAPLPLRGRSCPSVSRPCSVRRPRLPPTLSLPAAFPFRFPLVEPPLRKYAFSPEVVERLRVRHCLLASRELAEYVFKEVRTGRRRLEEVAETLSLCEKSRGRDGDLGWVERSNWNEGVTEVFWEECAKLRPGVLSVVEWEKGWSVVRVEDCRHGLRVERKKKRSRGWWGEGFFESGPKEESGAGEKGSGDRGDGVEVGSYVVKTMGCQMNMADSERMKGELERLGLREAKNEDRAQVVVLNTCSIREHAQSKVYSYMGNQVKRKVQNQGNVVLAVAGCVAQQEGAKLLRTIPELDLVFGPQYANRLGDLLEDVRINQSQVVATDPLHISEDISKPKRSSTVTAWVNVMYGCSERCTYCVVPNVRGLEQSRPMDAIKKEMESVAAMGHKEVVLLGQNVDAYGRDLYPRVTLSDLLRHVHDVKGIERIRFTTSHPRYISRNLITTVASLPKVMEAFLIPPQSGNDEVLRRMLRGYDARRYRKVVARIREEIPDASISGDVIVGFPGETEEQFMDTLQLLEDVEFDTVHTAAYSPRPNTPAAEWEEQVDEDVKSDRLARINELVKKHALKRSQRYLGRLEEVLIEGRNARIPKQVYGRNRGNRLVYVEGDENELKGKIIRVKIEKAFPFSLVGSLVA